MDSVRTGKTQASDSFVDTFEKVYSFTLKNDANFMLNFGFTNHSMNGMKHILLKFILILTCFIRKI